MLEEIKGDLHKWQSIPCLGVGGSEALLCIAEKIILLTFIYRYKEFPIRVSADFFLKMKADSYEIARDLKEPKQYQSFTLFFLILMSTFPGV